MRLARVPAAAWRQRIRALLDELGRDTVVAHVRTWLGNVPGSKPGMLVRSSLNRELLRGLLWLCPELADAGAGPVTAAARHLFLREQLAAG